MADASTAGTGSLWNANSWHWEEKQYTEWATEWLHAKLSGIKLAAPGFMITVPSVESISGSVGDWQLAFHGKPPLPTGSSPPAASHVRLLLTTGFHQHPQRQEDSIRRLDI